MDRWEGITAEVAGSRLILLLQSHKTYFRRKDDKAQTKIVLSLEPALYMHAREAETVNETWKS